MTDRPNISTEHQPKGAGRKPSDTLDRPDTTDEKVAEPTDRSPAKPGAPDVVDENGRALSGDGIVRD